MNNENIIRAYRQRKQVAAELEEARRDARQHRDKVETLQRAAELASLVTDVHNGVALRVDGEHVWRLDDTQRSAQVWPLVGDRKGVFLVTVRNGRREDRREFTSRDAAYAHAKDAITR